MKDNKLIAEFMRHEPIVKGDDVYYELNHIRLTSADDLRYHNSWDWLMPVLKKIDDMLLLDDDEVNDAVNRVHNAVLLFDIDNTYDAVVEFINQYNNE